MSLEDDWQCVRSGGHSFRRLGPRAIRNEFVDSYDDVIDLLGTHMGFLMMNTQVNPTLYSREVEVRARQLRRS